MSRTKWEVALSLAVVLLIGSEAWAQRQAQPQAPAQGVQPRVQQGQAPAAQRSQQNQAQQRTTFRPVQGGNESIADHQIAVWLLMCNEKEVALSQLAAKQAHSQQVRQFAEQMTKEHHQLVDQLRQFAPDAPMLAAEGNAREGNQNAQANARRTEPAQAQTQQRTAAKGQDGEHAQQGLPFDQISRQLVERGLQTARQELSKKQGAEFDKCFMGMQIFEHENMLNTLEVLRPYASQQLAADIEKAIQPTQSHLQHAKQIMEELDKQSSTSQSKTGAREERSERDNRR